MIHFFIVYLPALEYKLHEDGEFVSFTALFPVPRTMLKPL